MGADLKRISHTHDQIIDWMLLNPQRSLGECARYFGYTQAWLSMLIHSDLFQALKAKRQEELWGRCSARIEDNLTSATHLSLVRLNERLEADALDNKELISVADKFLTHSGYGAKPEASQQVNFLQIVQQSMHLRSDAEIGGASGASVRPTAAAAGDVIDVEAEVGGEMEGPLEPEALSASQGREEIGEPSPAPDRPASGALAAFSRLNRPGFEPAARSALDPNDFLAPSLEKPKC